MPEDDAFLSRVTHDLRGELATMVTGVHYLMRYESGLGDAGKQMLERVNGAGDRLRRLLDELEHAAWIGGRPPGPLAVEPCTLSFLEGALRRLERSVAQRHVTVHAELSGDLPEIEGDAELLGVALEYILDFAVARAQRSSVEVHADGPATLSVIDEGGAVDPAALARLFEPFAEKELIPRPEPGVRRRERLGLGLAIARGILSAHGGALRAEQAPSGRGLALRCTIVGRCPGPAV